jgi:hypothetical protein
MIKTKDELERNIFMVAEEYGVSYDTVQDLHAGMHF